MSNTEATIEANLLIEHFSTFGFLYLITLTRAVISKTQGTTPYLPKVNGMVEWFNNYLLNIVVGILPSKLDVLVAHQSTGQR